MSLTDNDLNILAKDAIKAAIKAGQYIASRIGERHIVENKLGKSKVGDTLASQVVTEVDLQSQTIILKSLQKLTTQYNFGVLTEELEDDNSRFNSDYFWCIDPIDGTLPFIENRGGFSVVIALVSKSGKAQIGVVLDPRTNDLYHAVIGCGAFRNGEELHLKNQIQSKKLRFISDSSFTKNKDFDSCLAMLKQYAADNNLSGIEVDSGGGAALHACWMLDQVPACYFKFPKNEQGGGSIWDYAASSIIAKEAGAVATDIFGVEFDLNNRDTTFMNKGGILYATNVNLAEEIRMLYRKTLIAGD